MLLVVLAAIAWIQHMSLDPLEQPVTLSTSAQGGAATQISSTSGASAVQVPSVGGLTVNEARVVLSAAGFEVVVRDVSGDASGSAQVVEQTPESGTVAALGSAVEVRARRAGVQVAAAKKSARKRWVVCIDPGHQQHADQTPEPIGPGSPIVKPSVTAGTTGVAFDMPEYEVALQIAVNLKRQLEEQGVRVVMTRTTNDVNMSNRLRADVANRAKADLFVRIHANGSPDETVGGAGTLYPKPNRWTRPIAEGSLLAARAVQSSLVQSTGAFDRGVLGRGDLSGFNYSEVPTILVEVGYMSNPVEDRLLASPHYQDKLAAGMTSGILTYLRESER